MQQPDAFQLLREIYDIDQLDFGMAYIRKLTFKIAQILKVKYVLVGRAVEPERVKIKTDFIWSGDSFIDNVTYDLAGTPCANVICGTRVAAHAADVQREFPTDKMLSDMMAESYIGAPFLRADGGLCGLLVVIDDKPIQHPEIYASIVEFFANRIGTEYSRQAYEDSLVTMNETLERCVRVRTQELQQAFLQAHEMQEPMKLILQESKKLLIEGVNIREAAELIHQSGMLLHDLAEKITRDVAV